MSALAITRYFDETNYISNTPIPVSDTTTMLVHAISAAVTIEFTLDSIKTIENSPGSVVWHTLDMSTLSAAISGGTNPVALGTKTLFVWEFCPIAFRFTTTGTFKAWIKS